MIGGISLFLTVISTGYSLCKEIMSDLEKNDERRSKEFRKHFRRLPKSERQKLMKEYVNDPESRL